MCLNPIRLTKNVAREVDVPCGKCPQCLSRRTSGWSFRLMQQHKVCDTALFLTLTIATEHMQFTPKRFMTLDKTHVQKFMKRLRKAQFGSAKSNIKYYICGEYGGKTNRPHYHAILFNAKTELIQDAWQYGQVHYGIVSEASVGYTLKYMSKPTRIPMHQNDDRKPEFSLMSKGLATTISLLKSFDGTMQPTTECT